MEKIKEDFILDKDLLERLEVVFLFLKHDLY